MPRGRKPVDQSAVGGVLLRQRVYDAIRARGDQFWTITEISSRAKANTASVQSYVDALQLAGIVESEDERRHKRFLERYPKAADINFRCSGPPVPFYDEKKFCLAFNAGAEAPRVTQLGEIIEGLTVQELIWKAARVFRRFAWTDIVAVIETVERPVRPATVKAYLADLHAAGYLKKAIPSRPGVPALWSLRPERDTGPRAPMVQRSKTIFDPNTGQTVFRWTDAEPVDQMSEERSA